MHFTSNPTPTTGGSLETSLQKVALRSTTIINTSADVYRTSAIFRAMLGLRVNKTKTENQQWLFPLLGYSWSSMSFLLYHMKAPACFPSSHLLG